MSNYEAIKKELREKESKLLLDNHHLRERTQRISTADYNGGLPNIVKNRGDKSSLFSFPFNFAKTCKELAYSSYLEPVLLFYKQTFNTFNYKLKLPKRLHKYDNQILEFMEEQFDRAGGLNRLIVNLAYNTLLYGFNFFTSKTNIIDGNTYGLNQRLYGITGFKLYDSGLTTGFLFDEDDVDVLRAVNYFSANKTLFNSTDILDDIIRGEEVVGKELTIDLEANLGALIYYGNNHGDVIGRPFLYQLISQNQMLEALDDSFIKALDNLGEHSYNFVPFDANSISDSDIKNVERQVRNFVENKGGIFISKYGKIEKLEAFDGREWFEYKNATIEHIYKSKGLDVKALGMNRGATRNLAEMTQTDSVLQASDIMNDFIYQLNNTFMRYYFDCNFKHLRINGEADYLTIEMEVPESTNKAIGSSENIVASAVRNETRAGQQDFFVNNNNASLISYDKQGNVKKRENLIELQDNRFIKNSDLDMPLNVIIDVSNLDKVLRDTSDEISSYLRVEMQRAIRDREFIKNNILGNKKSKSLGFPNRQDVINDIKGLLYNRIHDMVEVKTYEAVRGLGSNGAAKFKQYTGLDINAFINKETDKFMNRSGNRVAREIVDRAEEKLRQDIKFYTDSADKTIDIEDSVNEVDSQLINYKADKTEKITDRASINMYQDVSNAAQEDLAKKKDVAIIRVGVLETMCSVCKEKMGQVFIKDKYGNWYNDDYPYTKLPDKDCLGGAFNCNCYYTVVDRELIDNALYLQQNDLVLKNRRV